MGGSQNVSLLMDAFDTFKQASITLESYYKGLEQKIEVLNLELAEKNNYLLSILEGLPVGVIVTDDSGRIKTINSATCTILQECQEELIGKSLIGKLGCIDRVFFSSSGPVLDSDGGVLEGKEFEAVIVGRDGKKKTIIINYTILTNLQGQRTGCLIALKDISEIKRLKERSQRDKKLTAMGEMAASIAHQIRNPLGSIELFASLLHDEITGNLEGQRFAREIIHAVRQLNTTLSNMLLFANNSKPYKTEITIKELIEETIGMLNLFLKNHEIEIEIFHKDPEVSLLADRELVKQVLLNLIMNGIEVVEKDGGGKISIHSKRDKDGVHILVADNGCGIPEEDIDRIFDPFFTTKPKGTGLGLTVVNNIVKAHKGFIEVESSNGKGTTFEIILPEVEEYEQNTCSG